MEFITNNPDLKHIAEDIFECLDKKSLIACRSVNTSWKNILNHPMFYLRNMKTTNYYTDDNVKTWKNLARKLASERAVMSNFSHIGVFLGFKVQKTDDIEEELALVLAKMISNSQKLENKNKAALTRPLQVVRDLGKPGKYPNLTKFILEILETEKYDFSRWARWLMLYLAISCTYDAYFPNNFLPNLTHICKIYYLPMGKIVWPFSITHISMLKTKKFGDRKS